MSWSWHWLDSSTAMPEREAKGKAAIPEFIPKPGWYIEAIAVGLAAEVAGCFDMGVSTENFIPSLPPAEGPVCCKTRA